MGHCCTRAKEAAWNRLVVVDYRSLAVEVPGGPEELGEDRGVYSTGLAGWAGHSLVAVREGPVVEEHNVSQVAACSHSFGAQLAAVVLEDRCVHTLGAGAEVLSWYSCSSTNYLVEYLTSEGSWVAAPVIGTHQEGSLGMTEAEQTAAAAVMGKLMEVEDNGPEALTTVEGVHSRCIVRTQQWEAQSYTMMAQGYVMASVRSWLVLASAVDMVLDTRMEGLGCAQEAARAQMALTQRMGTAE